MQRVNGVRIERIDGVPVARVSADIDAANAAAVHEQLSAALSPDTHCLIVDLSETRYLDSAGLDMLLRLSYRLTQRRAKLMLVIPEASQLNRLAAIVGLPEAMGVHPTLAAAQHAAPQLSKDQTATPPTAPGQQQTAGS
jgi:anti-anti-sigma factor